MTKRERRDWTDETEENYKMNISGEFDIVKGREQKFEFRVSKIEAFLQKSNKGSSWNNQWAAGEKEAEIEVKLASRADDGMASKI